MVPDAYVRVLTGGVGLDELREFYSKKFIPQMPPDAEDDGDSINSSTR
jgi:carboxymethylenebutenolidase